MLMITEERNDDVLIFKLAGALAGAWARRVQALLAERYKLAESVTHRH